MKIRRTYIIALALILALCLNLVACNQNTNTQTNNTNPKQDANSGEKTETKAPEPKNEDKDSKKEETEQKVEDKKGDDSNLAVKFGVYGKDSDKFRYVRVSDLKEIYNKIGGAKSKDGLLAKWPDEKTIKEIEANSEKLANGDNTIKSVEFSDNSKENEKYKPVYGDPKTPFKYYNEGEVSFVITKHFKKPIGTLHMGLAGDYLIVCDPETEMFGVIDKYGKYVIPCEYGPISYLVGKYFAVMDDYKDYQDEPAMLIYYNDIFKQRIFKLDKPVTENSFFYIRHFKDDIFHVYEQDRGYYFIDANKSGEEVYKDLSKKLQIPLHFTRYGDNQYIATINELYPYYLIYINETEKGFEIYPYSTLYVKNKDFEICPDVDGDGGHYQMWPRFYHTSKASETVVKALNSYFDEYRAEYSENKDHEEDGNILSGKYEHQYYEKQNGEILTIVLDYRSNFFGAHGMEYEDYHNFDLKTGKLIELKDLFKSGVDIFEVLTKAMIPILKGDDYKEYCLAINNDVDEMRNMLFNPDSKLNYYQDDKNIVIIYNVYEIASYAAGIVEVKIPKSSLSKYLK